MNRKRAERRANFLFSLSRWMQVGMLASLLVVGAGVLLVTVLRFRTVQMELLQTREQLAEVTQSQELLKLRLQEVSVAVNENSLNRRVSEDEFIYTRQYAYLNVIRLAQDFPYTQKAKKQVYEALGQNILQAADYADIIFEMSRLPVEEYQARIMLETNPELVTQLSEWVPIFTQMAIPVRIPGRPNDGRGFRITSGYSDSRSNPFGSGGFEPHYAVDIMNVNNISLVDYGGYVERDDDTPGEVIAAADGRVVKVGFDPALFGNYLEVLHPINAEVLALYPEAEAWSSFYAHLRDRTPYSNGDSVLMGERLGFIGNTGYSTGAHLHFEIRVYYPGGRFWDARGRYDKIDPYSLPKG